ncbi:MAG: hypothetical protein B7Y83_03845 [Flavobacteriales bacterium 32-34-25]|nr:MAG: hypothetical protein B7Y83_03845 [Flavobacteriales bacterium 32-34-25]
MKKVVYTKYGNVDVLNLEEIEKPIPNNQQFLIKIKSVAINPIDWKIFMGDVKLMSGSKFPKYVGCDFSGIIEMAGSDVLGFKVGDEIFGILDPFKDGVLGEYVLADEKQIALKPANISFEHAATIPTAGQTALQMLVKGNITKGQHVLINGASGGVGMFAIQIAKNRGAVVTAVASAKGQEFLKKWGSDYTIDYNKQNVSDLNRKFDVILELSNKLPYPKAKKIMNSQATYITAIPELPVFINSFFNNLISKKKYKFIIMKPNVQDLNLVADYVAKGMGVHVSNTYPLTAYKEAYIKNVKEGALGKDVFIV